jgi:hypothetical protein
MWGEVKFHQFPTCPGVKKKQSSENVLHHTGEMFV